MRHFIGSIVAAFFSYQVFWSFANANSEEGISPSGLVPLLVLGTLALLLFLRPRAAGLGLAVMLLIVILSLDFWHMRLALGKQYTDCPQCRLELVRYYQRRGKLRQDVRVHRVWHTWLTGLYEVHPALIGQPGLRD